jgi:hypothetical protein
MARFYRKRIERNRLKFSRMGKRSQDVQRELRESEITPELLMDIETAQACGEGSAVGSIEIRNFITGKVRRWTLVRGHRKDQYALRSPDGRTSRPHSATWIMDHLRGRLLK